MVLMLILPPKGEEAQEFVSHPSGHVLRDAPGVVTPISNQPAHTTARVKPENDLHEC